MMTFNEIVSAFANGAKIRRKSWSEKTWMELDGNTVKFKAYFEQANKTVVTGTSTKSDKIFSLEDVLADDWEFETKY